MNVRIFRIRYYIASTMINLGIHIMPDCEYKRLLIESLLELKKEFVAAIYAKLKKESEDGNQ